MSNLSTSWEDEPAHISRPSDAGSLIRSVSLAKPHSYKTGLKRKKRVPLDEIILQVSAGSKPLVTDMAQICAQETLHEGTAVPERSEQTLEAPIVITVAEAGLPPKENVDKGVVRSEPVVPLVSEEPRKRKRVKKETANENPDKTIAATSSNVVFQDLKSKGGTKSNKGAENLRRRISRARNERWREANGFRRKGKRAAQFRREQISREMAHEKNLLEAVNEQNVVEMFSQGVDREIIQRLLGQKNEDDPNLVSIQPHWPEDLDSVSREDLEKFLSDEFKYDFFRAGQFEAISSVLTGSRSLIVLPTGAGKSLCYQFPSVFLRKKFQSNFLTIVVSPLIALMSDQLKLLPSCCRGAALHSNLSPTQTSLVFSAVQGGLIDVLFLAPERMLMYSMKDVFAKSSVLLVAIDEAHCLSEWSHSFRPAYMSVPKILDFDIKPKSILALTATATIQTVDSLRSVLSLTKVIRTDGVGGESSSCVSSNSQVQRKNLELFAKRSHNPVMDLLEFLTRPEMKGLGPIIVYVNYKWQTENVSQVLRERGLGAAEGYHGGLSAVERKEIHEKFIHNELRFVVATVAFGMGIDKKNVRSVVHLTVPKSIENYVQETGRCSRDNMLGRCRCYFNAEDYSRIRNKMVQDALKIEGVENLLNSHLWNPPNDASRNKFVFIPETIESVSKQHMSLLLALAESFGLGTVFQGFPRIVKLRFFSSSLEDLSLIDPFVNILYTSPKSGEQSTVSQSGGVATVDIVSAIEKSGGLTPPQFMHQLSVTAKAQKFTVAKSEWGHIFIPLDKVEHIGNMHEVCEKIFQTAIANHLLELNRLDASFALLSRIAAESIDNETIGHTLIQAYFEAEERLSTGEDLVQSVLQDAPPAVARSVLREIESLRNCN